MTNKEFGKNVVVYEKSKEHLDDISRFLRTYKTRLLTLNHPTNMNKLYAEIKESTDILRDMLGMPSEEEKDICPLCEGTKEVNDYEYDRDAHMYMISGTRACECQNDNNY